MIQPLRNLARRWARRWAGNVIVRANDALRRELIRTQARIDRQVQTLWRGERKLLIATKDLEEATETIKELREELSRKEGQIERQADVFEEYRAEIAELRRHIADADNTAARNEARQP